MAAAVGFQEARKRVIQCLKDGAYAHEPRKDINQKNLLHAGTVSPVEVIEMAKGCTGNDHDTDKHDADRSIEVHFLSPKGKFDGWYIKFYFVPDGTMFISVHQ